MGNLKFRIFLFFTLSSFLFMPMKIYAEDKNQSWQAQEQKLDKEIEALKKKLTELKGRSENKNLKKPNKEVQKLKDENLKLKKMILDIENARKSDMSSLYQELGTTYIQTKLFGPAIDAYTKALSLNPNNAEINYNLGLLYQHSQGNTKKALYHFKKYLRLEPEARNRKEVESLINMLEETPVVEIK